MTKCNEKFRQECLVFFDNRATIVIEENKRKFIGNNTKREEFALYRVDGCIITVGQRCDYLLLSCVENSSVAYLVELKGADLNHAVRQINTTLDALLPKLNDCIAINARIVLSKVNSPDINSVDYIKLRKKIEKLGGNIKQQMRILEETV